MTVRRRVSRATKIARLLPDGGSVLSAFRRMQIAEEELARSGVTHPGAFLLLCPPPALANKADDVYRSHVRELLARILAGEDVSPPTSAELLSVVLDTATVAPLTETGLCVAEVLFRDVFRGDPLGTPLGREPWPGAILEELGGIRRRFRTDRRLQQGAKP